MSNREKILTVYESILIDRDEKAATLDAVARGAGVSKGGLLYHFSNKRSLTHGLIERLITLADEDLRAMESAPEGPISYYLANSTVTGDAYSRALIAVNNLGASEQKAVTEALVDIQQRTLDILREQTNSEIAAYAVLLLGDGLYHNAITHGLCAAQRNSQLNGRLLDYVTSLAHDAPSVP